MTIGDTTLCHNLKTIAMNTQNLKKCILLICALALSFFFITDMVSAKENKIEKLLSEGKLPSELKLKDNETQKFLVITDYFNKDIFGNFFNKQRYQGIYSRGYSDGKVKWNNVSVSNSTSEKGDFPVGNPLTCMEDFSYLVSPDMMKAESFPNFPPTEVDAKNLVWDMMGFEGFAWLYFDSLRLNEYYDSHAFNGKVPMEGVGTFENRNILLKWSGITVMKGEKCAVIEFLAMDNPLDLSVDTEYFKLIAKGRSHYWGTILVSISDKQIEQAILHEDVLLDMVMPDGKKQLANTTRLLTVEKLK
jgi:hypothetical protein